MKNRTFSLQNSAFIIRRRGFSLLETMLALVLFATGTVAAAELFHRAQAGSADGEHLWIATYRAQECMEALRNLTFAGLTVGTGVLSTVSGCGTSASGLPTPGSGPSGEQRVVDVQFVPSTSNNLKQITVTVSWTAPGGTTNAVLQTYRSNV